MCHIEAGREYKRAIWNGRHPHSTRRTCPTFTQYLRLLGTGPIGGSVLEHLAFCSITDTTLHIFGPPARAPIVINEYGSQLFRMIMKEEECLPLCGNPRASYLVDSSIDIFGWGSPLGPSLRLPIFTHHGRQEERESLFIQRERQEETSRHSRGAPYDALCSPGPQRANEWSHHERQRGHGDVGPREKQPKIEPT